MIPPKEAKLPHLLRETAHELARVRPLHISLHADMLLLQIVEPHPQPS